MGHFTSTTDGNAALTKVRIAAGTGKRLRLTGVKARIASDISVTSSMAAIVAAKLLSAPYDGPKGVWTVDLEAKAEGKAKISASHKNTPAASIDVEVFKPEKISLDANSTEAGMLQRLLLAEAASPSKTQYKSSDVETSMEWMIVVVENRRKDKNPGRFMARDANKDGWDKRDIIRAKGQFHGFENYPVLAEDVRKRIESYLKIGNDYEDTRHDIYAAFLKRAIKISKASLIKDPSPDGLFGWRTEGSGSPGPNYVKFKDLAGQTFYTLKKPKK